MQQNLRVFQSIGVRGVSTYAEPGDWFAYELNHYALARLAWNPDADVDALVREFCTARYGPQADAAANVFAVLGDVVRTYGSLPFTSLKQVEEIDAARARLEAAVEPLREAASGDANVQRLLAVCEHATRDLAIQSMRARRRPESEVRAAIVELNQFLASHAGEGISLVARDEESASALMRRYGLRGPSGPAATTSVAPARR